MTNSWLSTGCRVKVRHLYIPNCDTTRNIVIAMLLSILPLKIHAVSVRLYLPMQVPKPAHEVIKSIQFLWKMLDTEIILFPSLNTKSLPY